MLKIDSEIDRSYKELYFAYKVLNKVGWQGRLPPVILHVSNRMNGKILGTACHAPNGNLPIHLIRLTHRIKYALDAEILCLLAHEMTHIWQFATGLAPLHNKCFYNELKRIGIDEKNLTTYADSPYGFTLNMINMHRTIGYEAPLQHAGKLLSDKKISNKDSCLYFVNNIKNLI